MEKANIAATVAFNRIPDDVKQRWKVVRDVISGDQVLRAGNYLPYLNSHDESLANVSRNNAYRQRAVWFPATSFTLEGLTGLAYRVDPTVDLPGKMEDMTEDVDGAGVSLYQQSQSVLGSNVQIGRHGLYVDWAEELGRPVIKSYSAESIINWRYTIVGGKSTLSMIVFEEEVEEEDGEWGLKKVTQWREVYLDQGSGVCNVRVWRDSDPSVGGEKQKQIVPFNAGTDKEAPSIVLRSRGKPLTFIPFTFIGSQNNDGSIDVSPLYGLAQVNLAHFRNSADYEDSVFFVGQVQPYITGLTEDWRDHLENPTITYPDGSIVKTGQTLYVGSRTPILLPEHSTFGYAQAQPNQIVKEAMDQKEAQMIAIGARMIEATGKGGSRTATEDENDREATTSVLSLCVSNVSEAYQRAFWFAAQYLDMGETFDAAATFKINQDFTRMSPDSALMAELVKSWQTGIIAKDDVRDFYRRIGIIPTERDNEQIDDSLATEGPALGLMGMPGTPPGTPAIGGPKGAPGAGGNVAISNGPSNGPNGGVLPEQTGPSNGPSNDDDEPPDLPPGDTREEQIERTQRGFPSRKKPPIMGDSVSRDTDANERQAATSRADAQGGERSNVVPLNPPQPPARQRTEMVEDVTPRQPTPATMEAVPFDIGPVIEAIRAGFASIQFPAPIINIENPAPVINVAAPTVNVDSPSINVESPAITVNPPSVTLPSMNVIVEKAAGNKQGKLIKTANGYELEVTSTDDER